MMQARKPSLFVQMEEKTVLVVEEGSTLSEGWQRRIS